MAAYVISEVAVTDPTLMDRYRSLAQASIARYGGRYIVRGGAAEVVEGGPPVTQLVIVEFPSIERAHEWYHSPEYAEALAVRQHALTRRLIFVEGMAAGAG
jgi:uncharacterized protein (DUF1330 family)